MSCRHRIIKYVGVQETPQKYKNLYLFNCVKCNSTISLEGFEVTPKMMSDEITKNPRGGK